MPKSKPAPDQEITLTEASELCGLHVDYLRQLAIRGRLKARKIGHFWVTTPAHVKEFITSRQKRGTYRNDVGG